MAGSKELTDEETEYLMKKYTNLNFKGAFSSSSKFFKAIKEDGKHPDLSFNKIKKFLATLSAHSLHQEYRRPKKFNKIIAPFKNYCLGIDLIDMQRYSRSNNKKRYILIAMDLFTRRIFLKGLANKKAASVLKALKEVFRTAGKSLHVFSDLGSEFRNDQVLNYLKSVNINAYTARDPVTSKVSPVERCVRTLKGIMSRYFTHSQSHRWWPNLNRFARIYNSSYHRVIKCTPYEAWSGKVSRAQIWMNSYMGLSKKKLVKRVKKKKSIFPSPRYKYKLHDIVKVVQERTPHQRQLSERYSRENFRVECRFLSGGIKYYNVKDLHDQEIRARFRENELTLSTSSDKYQVYQVDKVLKRRTVRGEKYALIQWIGLRRADSTWVKLSDLRDVR